MTSSIVWQRQNLRELPKFRDGTTYLYLEHTRLEQDGRGVRAYHPEGMVTLPAASLSVLLLGPGCSVSHEAVKALSDTGCSLLWVGEGGVRLYASGIGETRSAQRLQQQAGCGPIPTPACVWCGRCTPCGFLRAFPKG